MKRLKSSAACVPVLCVEVKANPSLALVKYWGKRRSGDNLPATTSVAVALGGLVTASRICRAADGETDRVELDGAIQEPTRFQPFFSAVRNLYDRPDLAFKVTSFNDFPSSSGLASSSSGFAALALGCKALADRGCSAAFKDFDSGFISLTEAQRRQASASARLGSVSAARAVYGGFTILQAGSSHAERAFSPDHWPEFRVLVVITSKLPKESTSRGAMEATRLSSPYYAAWVNDSRILAREALSALERKDMEKLGSAVRLSYSRMHASALAADPPVLYWLPASVAVIRACAQLRAKGLGAWETMDAGPQVKILCAAREIKPIRDYIDAEVPGLSFVEAYPAADPTICAIGAQGL